MILENRKSLKGKLHWRRFGALGFPSKDVNLRVFLWIFSGKLDREIGLDTGRKLDFFLPSGIIFQLGQMGDIGRIIRDNLDFPRAAAGRDGDPDVPPGRLRPLGDLAKA